MALKARITSMDEVPESQRSLYVEADDGGYRLDLEDDGVGTGHGDIRKALADERALSRQLKQKLARYRIDGKDLDVGAYQQAMTELEELRAKIAAGSPGESDRAKAQDDRRVTELMAKLEKMNERLESAEKERQQAKLRLRTNLIERAIDEAAESERVQPQYMEDARLRANLFTVLDDEKTVVLANSDGTPYEDENGKTIPAKQWMSRFVKEERPGWVQPSAGAGARGTGTAQPGARGVVSRDDPAGILANLDSIAKGKTAVQ